MIRSVALALALLLSAGAAGAQNVGPPPSGSAGTVTSVATGAGLTGGTITASGTLDLASVTAHDVMVGTGSAGAPTAVAPGTSGNVLTSNGATNDPSFQALPAFGAMVLITETVTTGSAASVTFSSIPATYRDLVVRVRGRCTASATGESLLMQVNADTNADYEFQNFYAYGGSPTYAENTGQTSWHAGDIACATATANWESSSQITIFDYRGTTFYKSFVSTFDSNMSTSASSTGAGSTGGLWASTLAITSVVVFPASGNFVNGTVVSLYGSY